MAHSGSLFRGSVTEYSTIQKVLPSDKVNPQGRCHFAKRQDLHTRRVSFAKRKNSYMRPVLFCQATGFIHKASVICQAERFIHKAGVILPRDKVNTQGRSIGEMTLAFVLILSVGKNY